MSFIEHLKSDTLGSLLTYFRPELAICVTIVLMLLARMICGRKLPTPLIVLIGSSLALFWCEPCKLTMDVPTVELFTGMLVYDKFTIFFRTLLMSFMILFVVFTWLSGIPDREDAADFYTLALGGLLGMCLMASANHLLTVFLAVEMASVPSYAMAGMLKGRRSASEAALKYSVYGAGTAGVMLYGISLLAGVLGTVHLPTLAVRLSALMASGADGGTLMVLGLGGLMLMVGLAFKLSAVPFHFWCPDVFEGASAEVNAFLSVASKAAALALLARVAIGIGFIPADRLEPQYPAAQVALDQQAPPDEAPAPQFRMASFQQESADETEDNVPVAPQVKSPADNAPEVPADLPPGSDPADLPPSAEPADLPPASDPTDLPPSAEPADLPPGESDSTSPSDERSQLRLVVTMVIRLLSRNTPQPTSSFDRFCRSERGLCSRLDLHCQSGRVVGSADLYVGQSGRLWSDEYQTLAGVFDHCPCRLYDDADLGSHGTRWKFAAIWRSDCGHVSLHRHVSLHEPGRVRHRGVPSKCHAERRDLRLCGTHPPMPWRGGLLLDHPAQPVGFATVGGICCQVPRVRFVGRRSAVDLAGDWWPEHGTQPVLLSARGEGDGVGSRTCRSWTRTAADAVLAGWIICTCCNPARAVAGCLLGTVERLGQSRWPALHVVSGSMTDLNLIDTLNRLLVLEFRSFAMYLNDADPWSAEDSDNSATEVLTGIQQLRAEYSQRLAELIQQEGGTVDSGDYPMNFTDSHDLSLIYLLGELQKAQHEILAEIELLIQALAKHPAAKALAEEILGSERAHQEMLDRLMKRQPSVS